MEHQAPAGMHNTPAAADAGLLDVYDRLLATYGPQGWWPGAEDPFVVAVGAILTQSVAWTNVEHALANRRAAAALTPRALLGLPLAELETLLRPSGYYTVKARRLRAFVQMLVDDFDGDLDRLFALPPPEPRSTLLATYGIGEETADAIILYAAGRPSFVVDAYTVRLFRRLSLGPPDDATLLRSPARLYHAWQAFFMDRLPADAPLFNEYHALIVRHSIARCRKRDPRCTDCPLLGVCPTGRQRLAPAMTAATQKRAAERGESLGNPSAGYPLPSASARPRSRRRR